MLDNGPPVSVAGGSVNETPGAAIYEGVSYSYTDFGASPYRSVIIACESCAIKHADWLVDLGPEGGEKGGRIVAEGTPEDVAKVPESYTGQYLKPLLSAARTPGKAPTP